MVEPFLHRKIVGKNILVLRKQAELTQEQLAEKSDLHCTYLSDVERGVENVSLDSLARIAHALKVKLSDLTTGS
jgi:transcriptional regulator with XRE-family HTH domain